MLGTVQSGMEIGALAESPHGWYMLGTVQSGMEIGALAESPVGLLAQLNAGAVRALDQRKARAALAAAQQQ